MNTRIIGKRGLLYLFILPIAVFIAIGSPSGVNPAQAGFPVKDAPAVTQPQELAAMSFGDTFIEWLPNQSFGAMTLTLSGPDGLLITQTFKEGTPPILDITETEVGSLPDGSYNYELTASPPSKGKNAVRNKERSPDNTRRGIGSSRGDRLMQSGAFMILDGRLVIGGDQSGAAAGNRDEPAALTRDQTILDDLIVDGSICVGFDCVNGESFGFDTLRLKENNLRIKFQDTSNSASFPTNDWQITANDSTNGGLNKFSIDDIDGGRTPFTIEAGAPSHSLYVDDGGRIGLGTSTPVVQLHVVDGNTPTLRLQQDGSSGFTPQTWDVAGNEANFFIRDATHGSTLPFRIQPSAPSNTLFLSSAGKVGIGTNSPSFNLHVKNSANPVIVVEETDGPIGFMNAETDRVNIGTASDHDFKIARNAALQMTFIGNGHINMSDGGKYDGEWKDASSRERKENIKALDTDEAMSTLEKLEPVKYNYKDNKEEENAGFIAEDVPDLVASNDRKCLSPMDFVAVLTKVVQQQQKAISEMKNEMAQFKKGISPK